MLLRCAGTLACLLICLSAARAAEDATAVVMPGEFTLSGLNAWQALVLEQTEQGVAAGQLSEGVAWESSDPAIVAIEGDTVRPVSNGSAVVTGRCGELSAQARVTVVGCEQPATWSFRNHVESVLARAGCSSGACHGAAAGKNGFRLSLRGYDPAGDFLNITRQQLGRRIVPTDPGRSLLLTKPSGGLPHRGGVRFRPASLEYRVIAEWVAAGSPPPADEDPRLERLEILPPSAVLQPGDVQQLLVRAHFTDGHSEDVTRWAKFTSANESVAQIDEQGRVRVMGHGDGALTAWYLSQVVIATVSAPFTTAVPPETFTQAARHNFIDDHVLSKLQALNLPPSQLCTDGEFIRRAFLDTLGVLPTADETQGFLSDAAPDKRDRLIDSLLARPEFVDYWTYKWSDLLLVNGERLPAPAMWSYYQWIRNHVQANTPWDVLARELITAKGSALENGATNFYVLHQDPLDMAETTTVTFLGMSINCARCHNHPLEKWTNNQYYAMANLFARVRAKDLPGAGNRAIFVAEEGDLIQPLTGRPQPPAPLDSSPISLSDPGDRREYLARWLTSPENPYFARAISNRVWANYLGTGLVEMVDDMRQTNPASNESLLAALAGYLVEQKFDLKALMRAILQSATYQRSSVPTPENAADTRYYARYYPRRLMAEVMLDAFSQVTGKPSQFGDYPAQWRALQLPDASVSSYFLRTFGRPERIVTCECERSVEPSMVQVLHISNGTSLNEKLQAADNRLGELLTAGMDDAQIVETLYLSALARYPTADEQAALLAILQENAADRRAALEDLYWSVLSSSEFLFNH